MGEKREAALRQQRTRLALLPEVGSDPPAEEAAGAPRGPPPHPPRAFAGEDRRPRGRARGRGGAARGRKARGGTAAAASLLAKFVPAAHQLRAPWG